MKKILLTLLVIGMTSCVSDFDRIEDAKKKYPNAIVTPSTSLLSNQGYEITVEDTISRQIYALSYYPFSTTKIGQIRNVR